MDRSFLQEKPLGYGQLTNVTASTLISTAFASGIPAGTALLLLIESTGAAIRWRDDTLAPTALIGQPLPASREMRYTASGMNQLRVIEQAPTAVVNVTAYAQGD